MSHQIKEKQMSHDRKSPSTRKLPYNISENTKKQLALGLDINSRFDKAIKRTSFNLSFSTAEVLKHVTSTRTIPSK